MPEKHELELVMYDDIGHSSANAKNVADELRYSLEYHPIQKVIVRINSRGGSVVEGFGLYAAINDAANKGVEVITRNDGLCASVALPVFLAGGHREMMDYGLVMIHDPYFPDYDTNEESKKALAKFKQSIVKMIVNNSNLSEQQVSSMMEETTWLDARQCLEYGLVHEVIETELQLSNKKRDPKGLVEAFNQLNDEIFNQSKEHMPDQKGPNPTTVTPEAVEALMQLGKAKGVVNKDNEESYKTLIKADYGAVLNLFNAASAQEETPPDESNDTPPMTVADLLEAVNKAGGVEPQAKQTLADKFLDLSKNDPKALAEIETQDPKKFADMQAAYIARTNKTK